MVHKWRDRLEEFLFPIESDNWLAILRVGLGVQLCCYCFSLRKDWIYLLASSAQGLVGRRLSEAILDLQSPLVPRVTWLVSLGAHLGMKEQMVLGLSWILLFAAGCCLLLGIQCRLAAIAAWFLYLCATKSSGLVSYGVDNFTTIGLFYLMIAPLPDRYSLDWRLRKPPRKSPRALGFFRRALQLHLCLIYFFSGLAKCLGRAWWDGSNLWRILIRPPFNRVPPEFLIKWDFFFPFAGIAICLLEIGYAFFIWQRATGKIWLVCICLMHVMIGLVMGMYLFALIMIVLNLAAFGLLFARPDPGRRISHLPKVVATT